ncbi:MAG: ECF transporter S component [Eubacteriales bacterium]|nr:ECF transporter S component [Eubacteriales bacterium]
MSQTKKLTVAGICLALAFLLPFLTAQIPEIGKTLAPMHIPVIICGFLAGPLYGAGVGFLAPIARSLFLSMPPMYPMALAMALELCAYGLAAALLHRLFKKNMSLTQNVYISLVLSMVIGRIVFGIAMYFMLMASGKSYTINMFINGTVLGAIPGIILHLLIIPPIVLAIKRSNVLGKE